MSSHGSCVRRSTAPRHLAPYAHDRVCASTAILELIGHTPASPAMTSAPVGAHT